MAALARAMMVGHRLLVLDEAFEGLAEALADRVASAVQRIQAEEHMTIIVAESRRASAELIATRFVGVERGEFENGVLTVSGI